MAIDFTLENHVATVTINRPERMNAMDDLATGLRLEQIMLRLLQSSQDVAQGTTAFAQKRAPSFTDN